MRRFPLSALLSLLIFLASLPTAHGFVEESHPRPARALHEAEEASGSPYIKAARFLIQRLLPAHAKTFELSTKAGCEPEHGACFRLGVRDGKVHIAGSTGVELAAGFYEFLKQACNSSISWDWTGGNQLDDTCLQPRKLSQLQHLTIYRHRAVPWHYYQNVVTVSYSFTWWDWKRWEREIDWMAVNGVNLALAFTGQELVWQRVFERYGISGEDLQGFFTGPAFLAWGRMGNIQGYSGPLPQGWMRRQAGLQKKILKRMRAFGMTPVLPAFAGFVPRAFEAKFPNATILRSANWGHFPQKHCCVDLLDPLDPLFQEIGKAAIEEMRREFGSDTISFYSADTFNEMLPPSSSPAFLSSVSGAVYSAMAAADPSAKWLMQAWTFFNDHQFWQRSQIQQVAELAYHLLMKHDSRVEAHERQIGANSKEDVASQLHKTSAEEFSVITCFASSTKEMYGDLEAVAREPVRALKAKGSTMIGYGLCMEAIEQNPVVYALMNEWPFRESEIDLETWIPQYVRRRYGNRTDHLAFEAWDLLRASVYNATDKHMDHAKDIPTSRPALDPAEIGQWGLRPEIWYDEAMVVEAWEKVMDAIKAMEGATETLVYDFIDIGRQVLSKKATKYWREAVAAYRSRQRKAWHHSSRKLLYLIWKLDELLSFNKGFDLQPRLDAVMAAGDSEAEQQEFEKELITQITVWGKSPSGTSELEDYANREWAGLMRAYYYPRWQTWVSRLDDDLEHGRDYNATAWKLEHDAFARNWLNKRHTIRSERVGSALEISLQSLSEFFPQQAS